jgi:ElaA protein
VHPLEFHAAAFADLDARTLYDLLRLRSEIFVVEQECAYLDVDGRDVELGTRHLWFSDPDGPVAYLRLLSEPGGVTRVGRVAVAAAARNGGLAGRLMEEALALIGDGPCVLDAQSYLIGFYARYGFHITGPEYVEDGIPHVPMRRDAVSVPRPTDAAEGVPR